MSDIENVEDIKLFVNEFYAKIKEDELLALVFALRIQGDHWDKHLHRMYDFWNTVLFFERTYKGNPFSKHHELPIASPHFSKWLLLFNETIDSRFKGDKAEETKKRAKNMATLFSSKMEYFANNPNAKPIM